MYTASFQISGWAGPQVYILSGETLQDVAEALNNVQDLSCLVMMGQMERKKKDAAALKKLSAFLDKYYAGSIQEEDLKTFDIKLSVGSFKCLDLLQSENAVDELKKEYPDAIVR